LACFRLAKVGWPPRKEKREQTLVIQKVVIYWVKYITISGKVKEKLLSDPTFRLPHLFRWDEKDFE